MDFDSYNFAAERMDNILRECGDKSCGFFVMDEETMARYEIFDNVRDNRGNRIVVGDWYVVVRCGNGYRYYINVTHDSVITMCAEVFSFLQYK